ncbi:MAG TPA: aconitate hydratase, partial [Mycobacteriales bacterium]|nr:aconitate hydratase [Mycobacteriales bacterium]
IAESYERIHRSNLVGMGVLPLQFTDGDSAGSLELTGRERYAIRGLEGGVTPRQEATVEVTREDGSTSSFTVTVRVDGPAEVEYYGNGGILQMVLRRMLAGEAA